MGFFIPLLFHVDTVVVVVLLSLFFCVFLSVSPFLCLLFCVPFSLSSFLCLLFSVSFSLSLNLSQSLNLCLSVYCSLLLVSVIFSDSKNNPLLDFFSPC